MSDQTPTNLDLTPEIINLEVQQATDVVLQFQLTDGAGDPVDLTDKTVKLTAKDGFAGTTMVATKTNAPGSHDVDLEGKTTFVLTKANLTTTEPDGQVSWKYEVRLVLPVSLREVVYIHGDLTLMPSVGLST